MKEKLEYLLREKQLSATSLARLLEIQPSGISHIMSGRNKPSFDLVVKILTAFPDINPDWLLLDSDEVYRRGGTSSTCDLFGFDDQPSQSDPSLGVNENIEFSESKNREENLQINNFSSAKNSGKSVDRIVVLYADGTFESFSQK
ncbi:MAG: helix-turn-helix transcriptional regulator [Alistipes sp.]|nr:helix-turn-helix transcriptional regulator [Alistipes sp.]